MRSKSCDVCVLDAGRLCYAGIGDEDIEPLADESFDLRGKLMRAVGRAEIGADRVRLAAGGTNFRDHGFGFHAPRP